MKGNAGGHFRLLVTRPVIDPPNPIRPMKIKKLLLLLLLVLPLTLTAGNPPNDNRYNSVGYASLAPLPVDVSAPFAGTLGGQIVVAGGCNFPDTPAAQGGAKKYYDKIYRYDTRHGRWQTVGRLPRPLAYGVSVTTPEGIVCVGGTDGTASRAEAFLMKSTGGVISTTPLPPLPVVLDNMAGAYHAGILYIVGGTSDGRGSNAVWSLDLQAAPHARGWKALPDYPGSPRVQPVCVVQTGSLGANLYLMGGFSPRTEQAEGFAHTDGLVLSLATGRWTKTASIKPAGTDSLRTLVGASGVASGCAHIVFMGGVNRDVFNAAINPPAGLTAAERDSLNRAYLSHSAAWYRFADELLIYHTITDTWVTESRSPLLARSGAAVVAQDGKWVVVGGETKPGIRSADVTAVEMTVRTDFGWLNWTVLGGYLVGMLLLGFYFMRRESGADDFFKGGGRIPWWAAGISIYATMLSAITYMAYPAKAYATDWTYYPMLVTILLVSFPVIRYYLPFFRRLNVTSAYEYLERRFNATTRLMASALFIIFMVARMALVLYLPSLALTAVTGIDIYTCIILMGAITIVYCTMGGVEAVVWGDVVQGIILVGGAFLAVGYLVLGTEGGVGGFIDIAVADEKLRLFDWSFDYRSATFWVIILGGMANNLISYTSDQTVIQRYLTTKDERSARRSILMNGLMSVFISVAFFAIGAGLYTFFKTHPAELDFTMGKTDTIFPFFMMSQLPAGLAGLLIAAIFAATMSTISSNINSVATAFSVDFYKRFRPGVSDHSVLRVARTACIVSGILGVGIALLMATWNILSLLDFFQEILGLLSSGLGGLFLMGIFFPSINGRAALAGFVSGVAVVFITKYYTETSFLLYGFIGMAVSVFVGWAISLILPEERVQEGLTWKTLKREK